MQERGGEKNRGPVEDLTSNSYKLPHHRHLNIVSALCVKAKDQLIHNTYLVYNSDSKE